PERLGESYGRAQRKKVRDVFNVAVIDCVSFLLGRIRAERTSAGAAGASTNALGMIDASHQSQNGLALSEDVPRQSQSRLPVNGLCMPEALKGRRIGRKHNPV